jgi:dUTP pyrophosphatase
LPTGIAIEFPAGYDVQVRPRSGLSSKGVMVSPGTIDADYRGEVFVTMWTFGDRDTYALADGDRVARARRRPRRAGRGARGRRAGADARGEGGHGSTGR